MKRSAVNVAWVLLGILTISALLMTLGERESTTNPRIDSYGPSGLAAFAGLLRANGYRVTTTSSPTPHLEKGDVAVVCLEEREDPEQALEDKPGVLTRLADFAKSGGKLLIMSFAPDFSDASKQGYQTPVAQAGTSTRTNVNARGNIDPSMLMVTADSALPSDAPRATVWKNSQSRDNSAITWLTRYEKGTTLSVSDGFMATNRHIGDFGNADVLMSSVATLATPGTRFVFVEASYTLAEASLIDVLGPGAAGMWYQFLFLFGVVVFTLGKRFGLPEEKRATQTGQRELVDAIADTYRRAHATRVACRAAYDRADSEVRRAIKLSSDAPASERDSRIPPELAREFRRVFESTIDQISAADAFERCRALRREVKAFLKRS